MCKAEDERQILLSYNGDGTSTETILSVQKRFGVGQALVMTDLDRNAFEFYISSGFNFGENIPDLSANFKNNLAISDNFDWSSSPDNIWQEEQSTLIEIETIPGCTTEVFEIVGRCSFMDVRLPQYTRVDKCHGHSNETTIAIPDNIVRLTYRKDIFTPVDNDIKTVDKYENRLVKNNAFEVVVEPLPFADIIAKMMKKF